MLYAFSPPSSPILHSTAATMITMIVVSSTMFTRHFLQKSPTINGCFVEKDLQQSETAWMGKMLSVDKERAESWQADLSAGIGDGEKIGAGKESGQDTISPMYTYTVPPVILGLLLLARSKRFWTRCSAFHSSTLGSLLRWSHGRKNGTRQSSVKENVDSRALPSARHRAHFSCMCHAHLRLSQTARSAEIFIKDMNAMIKCSL